MMDFIENNGILINIIINASLLVVGIISIFVIVAIYKIQKRDQLSYLEFRKQQEDKKRKIEIMPKFIDGGGNYTGTDFGFFIQIIKNIANDMRIEYDENKSSVYIFIRSKNIYSKDDLKTTNNMDKAFISFSCKDKTVNASISKPEYEFYLFFSDIDGNNYKALVTGKGISFKIIKPFIEL